MVHYKWKLKGHYSFAKGERPTWVRQNTIYEDGDTLTVEVECIVNVAYVIERTSHMASKKFFIELSVNFNDDNLKGKEEVIRHAAARMAKGLFSTAMLVSDRTQPKIQMVESDNFDGEKIINLSKYNTDGQCPTCGHEPEGA